MVKTLIESGDISTKLEEEMHVRELAFFMFLLSMDLTIRDHYDSLRTIKRTHGETKPATNSLTF